MLSHYDNRKKEQMTTPREANASWKPQVKVNGTWSSNALVFDTEEEAQKSAHDLFTRWQLTTDHRAIVSDEPVNYSYRNGKLIAHEGPFLQRSGHAVNG
jgi:hypothetical protein